MNIYKVYIMEMFLGYDIKDVMYSLNFLTKEDRNRLQKEYTFTIQNELKENISPKEENANKRTIKYMKQIIKIYSLKQNESLEFDSYTDFFPLFIGESKETILNIIDTLNKSDKALLIKKYGANFTDTIFNPNLTKEENKRIEEIIIPEIKYRLSLLKEGYVIISILDLISEFQLSELKSIIDNLDHKEKRIIHKLFNKNLDKKLIVKKDRINTILNPKLIEKIKKLGKSKQIYKVKYKSFFSLFEDMRKESETFPELESRVKRNIKEHHKPLLEEKYGADLKSPRNFGELTREENIKIANIVYCIKYFMLKEEIVNEKYYKPLLERMIPFTTYDMLYEEINTFNEKEKAFLQKIFETDYKNTSLIENIPKEDRKLLKSLVDILYKRILKKTSKKTGINVNVLNKLKNVVKTQEYLYLLTKYNEKISISVLMNKYFSDYCSIKDISQYTGVKEEIICACTIRYLYEENENMKEYFKETYNILKLKEMNNKGGK